ncbi:MAG TPA: cell division/cell wall cluster transcriptional repressor MraZ [Candidatus Monoglobus merdigallinarum]|uniref:Transcriptional regulator MraZ n=1 Tax=Candidatus Monoglobus merdigallinarum TaxID=2838698 RepID=A0A9D1TM36_9FIRM|nr:cell division/cell wall cluster transcriptional repressor MraZ [Candidatus Monoglobus merdigallinarum]
MDFKCTVQVRKEAAEVLIGEHMQTVDAKFRVNIPSGFRADLGSVFVVAKGVNCIAVYPKEEWIKFLEGLTDVKKLRFFASGSKECELDTQGRIVIPPNLREYIGLKKEIAVIGAFKRVEIWDRETWNNYFDSDTYSAENIGSLLRPEELI